MMGLGFGKLLEERLAEESLRNVKTSRRSSKIKTITMPPRAITSN